MMDFLFGIGAGVVLSLIVLAAGVLWLAFSEPDYLTDDDYSGY